MLLRSLIAIHISLSGAAKAVKPVWGLVLKGFLNNYLVIGGIMRKLIAAYPQAVLIFCLTLSLVVVGDINMANGQNTPTLEGEWTVTSTWTDTEVGGKFKIVRKGDRYDALFTPRMEIKGTVLSIDIPYYGSPTQIMAVNIPSYEELVSNFKAQSNTALKSALRKLAGNVTQKRRITLSADGRTAELEIDKLRVQYGSDGSLADYKIGPFESKTVLQRAVPVAGKVESRGDRASAIAQVESLGEFFVLTKDGRKLTGKDINQIPLEEGTKVITGSSGHVRMKLPDDTTFTIGPNSDIVIDSFVYDPDNTPKRVIANVSKGVFRWVTGKVKQPQDPAEMKVKLPVMAVGIRGTDFETTVNRDGSGLVVLHFGQLEITENKTGFKFIMDAGYKVTFKADGSVSRPMKGE